MLDCQPAAAIVRVTTVKMTRGVSIGPGSSQDASHIAFTDFYQREYRSVVGLAYALTGSGASAEELAQDAFTSAYRKWSKVSGYERPEAWVRQVLVNATRSWGRRQQAELRAMTRIRGRRQPLAELPESAEEFWQAVRRLPARQAQAIALRYLEERSVDDIAEILSCRPGTVKTHLHRGRRALVESLGLDRPALLDTNSTGAGS